MTAEHWSVRQKIEIPFQYTAGPAITRFLQGLQQRVIIASVCSKCGRRSVPPLSFCGRCWQPITEFPALTGRGTLVSFTETAEPGKVYGLIQLEGADSTLVHRVMRNGNALRIGSPVAPVWRVETTASIHDVEHFQVIGE